MTRRYPQHGMGLPAALFIITIMAMIAAALSRLIVMNAAATTEEIQLTRALYAAESGAGMALSVLYPPADYATDYGAPAPLNCSTQHYEFSAVGLENCNADISCAAISHENSEYFTITSTGTCGTIQRKVQVQSRFDRP